jgi:glycosyltransferase involved in cell wall biosynthesis
MYMGKPTIAVGRRWAVDFITDGVDGLIVDYQDTAALRAAMQRVLEAPEAARQMGERARLRAAEFTTERCMRTVYELTVGPHGFLPSPLGAVGGKVAAAPSSGA